MSDYEGPRVHWGALSKRKIGEGASDNPNRDRATPAPDIASNHHHRHPHYHPRPLNHADPGKLVLGQYSARMLAWPRVWGECVHVCLCVFACG